VAGIHGIHVWPPLPAGVIATRVRRTSLSRCCHLAC
jgi:hypothetical protein